MVTPSASRFRVRFRVLSPWLRPRRANRLGCMCIVRKSHAPLAAALAAAALAVGPATAQELPETRIVSSAKATPNKAGTARDPQGISIAASGRLMVEPGFDPPVVTAIDILVGRGLAWNGGRYVKCSKRTLDRRGPQGCPRKSIMGSAVATGRADTTPARVKMVIVNGGRNRTYAYATLNNPARVRETIEVKSRNLTSGKWGHRESVRVPETLQVVAGVPLRLNTIRMAIGGKPYAREYVHTTSCPRGGWKYQVTVHYLFDQMGVTDEVTDTGSIACRK
jgi:hypothetical protein